MIAHMPATIVWFRLDLRLHDNPALAAAAERGDVVPLFVWAPGEEGEWPPGAASRWWLHQSLRSLEASLKSKGLTLVFRRGPSLRALRGLLRECGADAVFWNRRVEPALRERDEAVEGALRREGVRVETFNGMTLLDPGRVANRSGKPYQVFTPFWRSCLSAMPDFAPLPVPRLGAAPKASAPPPLELGALKLEPAVDWAGGLREAWRPGEAGAARMLRRFVTGRMEEYESGRDLPAVAGTSRLSPHLHFGEISPRQVWAACWGGRTPAARAFLRQLGWREFAHHLLHHFPHTASEPLRPQFARFPWRHDPRLLRAWRRGRTGFPIVDAGMRELWATGWMHNRARMIAGSLLVKDLLSPWTEGARWFWNTLVDADLANNTLGWQWVAGCGADAAPYFRIFNPALQAARFDPGGKYAARWIPELGTGEYPAPVVSHAEAAERALAAYAALRGE